MAISVTTFKGRCLEIIRDVEQRGAAVEIERRGRVVARLVPVLEHGPGPLCPWERLRGSGRLLAAPEESVLRSRDFEASR